MRIQYKVGKDENIHQLREPHVSDWAYSPVCTLVGCMTLEPLIDRVGPPCSMQSLNELAHGGEPGDTSTSD